MHLHSHLSGPCIAGRTLLDDAVLLTQKEDVDYQSLPSMPTPEEFFLLSRVRGPVSVGQLCSASGLGREKTLEMLDRLIDFGLVETSGDSPSEAAPAAAEEPAPVAEEPVVEEPPPVAEEPEPVIEEPPPVVQQAGLGSEATSPGSYEDPGSEPILEEEPIRATPMGARPAIELDEPIAAPPMEPAAGAVPEFAPEERQQSASGFHRLETSNHGPVIGESEGSSLSRDDNPLTGSLIIDPDEDDDLFESGSIAHVSAVGQINQKMRPGFDGGTGEFIASAPADELFGGEAAPEDDLFGPAKPALAEESDIFGGGRKVVPSAPASQLSSDSDIFGGGNPAPAKAAVEDDLFGPAKPVPETLDDAFAKRRVAPAPAVSPAGSTRPVSDPLETVKKGAASTKPVGKAPPKVSLFGEETGHQTTSGTTLTLSLFPSSFDAFTPDVGLMSMGADLEPLHMKEILFVYSQLDHLTFYQLFGVGSDADRKSIRSAYFIWSKRFHPDLFFRKEVGEFGKMAETVFKWISKAHDVLSHRKKRAEYDELLAAHAQQVSFVEEQSVVADDNRKTLARDLLLQRGAKAEESGQAVDAVASYKKALSLGVDFDLLLKCSRLLIGADTSLDEAVLFARGALRERQENPEALIVLGTALEKKGAAAEALDAYERALDVVGSDPAVEENIARLRTTLGY